MHFQSLAGGLLAGAALLCPISAGAHDIKASPSEKTEAAFDIIETRVTIRGDEAVFSSRLRGEAGSRKPDATGKFEDSSVYAYVWPTSLNSADVGFEADKGIVALAVTFHPDFDDGAGGAANRTVWHPHWVVLAKDGACGGGLKVVDIPEGTTPKVPPTWPKVPLLIDSPSYPTTLAGDSVDVTVPLAAIGGKGLEGASFDGVTAGLRIDANLHQPLLCVADVFKVASGDLSLPGRIMPAD
ncbi:hypothetical protein [Gellertiella hungarica]|uniref:Uncharacterized protein n=1 Tax=Gellertiella hungarica TaxID=1572859 RepID=A0A7W6NJL5_9HYPH|nr:hypothetical protein [Gellertiella hungarica]MBB4063624.1 hypothetical protein [Gellertiella hungarica]